MTTPYISTNGFTLLEVLLALALSSFVLVALYTTFFTTDKVVSGIDEKMVKLQEAREVLDMLRRELESMFYKKDSAYTKFKIVDRDDFGKQTSRVGFTTFSGTGSELKSVEYFVKKENGKLLLVKKFLPLFDEREPFEITVIEELEEFIVEANRGLKTWDSELTLRIPDYVSLTLKFPINNKTVTLRQRAYPKIDAVMR